ncbi:HD-GYP domain-containing protein, partial [Sulfoacidibacillus ferrooxidans]|uniref:HD-GYP domain-containing protein n=1 Tax=Sulfoacidibacillus ferrooxidans TaxID=2005001 RepID=UPI001F504295
MKPTILCVDEDGVLTSAQGHTRLLFGCDDHDMLGLPYHLFLLDRPADHHIITTWGRQRSGIQVPMHVMEGLDSVDHEVWVHPVFGEQQESILLSYWQMYFQSLAYAAEYSDPDLLSHLQRVAMYTKYMAEQYLHWSECDVRRAVIAASVHDIGKIAITRSILFRPGPIDGPERAYVQAHTRYGYDLLHDLHTQAQQSSEWMVDDRVFELSKEVALYHHEH